MKEMAADTTQVPGGNWIGMMCTLCGLLYSKITASDLASVFTGALAIVNLIIAWPKLKARLQQIRNRKSFNNKNPPDAN